MPKKFYNIRGGSGVTYSEGVDETRELQDVFFGHNHGPG